MIICGVAGVRQLIGSPNEKSGLQMTFQYRAPNIHIRNEEALKSFPAHKNRPECGFLASFLSSGHGTEIHLPTAAFQMEPEVLMNAYPFEINLYPSR